MKKIKDIVEEIRNRDFTDSGISQIAAIAFFMRNPDGSSAKNIIIDIGLLDNGPNKHFESEELEVSDYDYELNKEYTGFVIVRCSLKGELQ